MTYYYIREPMPHEIGNVDKDITGWVLDDSCLKHEFGPAIFVLGTNVRTMRLEQLTDDEWRELNTSGYASIAEDLE